MLSVLPLAVGAFGGFAVVIALIMTAMVSQSRFRDELELNRRDLWESLGTPGSVVRKGRPAGNFYNYLMSGRYRDAGDPVLTRLGNRARLSTALFWLGLLAMIVYQLGFAAHR